MKSIRETRKGKEEQTAGVQSRKMGKQDEASRPQRAAFGDLTNAVQKDVANGKKDVGKKVRQTVEVKVSAPKTRSTVTTTQALAKKTRKPTTTTAAAVASTITSKTSAKATTVATSKTGAITTSKTTTLATSKVAGGQVKAVTVKKGKPAKEESKAAASKDTEVKVQSQALAAAPSEDLSDMTISDLELSSDSKDHSGMSVDQSIHDSSMVDQKLMPEVPVHLGVEDVDSPDLKDPNQEALYAYDVFLYYKEREAKFRLRPYLVRQPEVSQRMRAVLVDWMVEVQENFELNHETLYLGVKLVDTYMSLVPGVERDMVQLLGAVALFLASKFDERMPPAIDDFTYICDHAYDREQFLSMERELFRTVGFDLGCPLSYRFLRRYAKCGRSETKTLYLARFILELSLMEYKFVFQSESMMAASVLYIARMMRQEGEWTPSLEYYTGYTLKHLRPLIEEINNQTFNSRYPELHTIRLKYQHHIFLSVADIPPLSNSELFPVTNAEKQQPALH